MIHQITRIGLFILIAALCFGQAAPAHEPPMSLDEIIDFVSEPALADAVEKVIAAVQLNGLDFGLDNATLTRIIDAAAKGKRSPEVTARLVLQILQACPDCRSRYFGPMNRDQILVLLNKKLPPHIALQEIQLRTPDKDVPKTPAFAEELRRAGANPEFVEFIIPSDEIEQATPSGYAKIPLVRAEAYNRQSKFGRLLISADIVGQVEFLFLHNALFWKPIAEGGKGAPMGEARSLGSSFTAPAPKVEEAFVEYDFELVERTEERQRRKLLPGILTKGAGIKGLTYEGKGNAPHGFKFTVTETDKQPHAYEIRLRWNVRDTAKPSLK